MRYFRPLAAALIGLATILAVVWALYVPIFQAPDEELHLDYALSLMTAGHLLSVRDRPPEPEPLGESNPLTAYLVSRTAFSVVAHHPVVKAPADYGSSRYYADLDHHAPSDAAAATQASNPYLLAFYPFGYYALLGAWLSLLHHAGIGLVGLVFGARLLSAAMLGVTLVLALNVLREMHVRRGYALMLTGIAGLFPLTTFVASSIQPDSLSSLLVYLTIYLALVLGRTRSIRAASALGFALGFLLVTKYQFFACVVAPLAVYLATRTRRSGIVGAANFAAIVIPVTLLAIVQLWIVWGGRTAMVSSQDQPLHWNYAALSAAAAVGIGPLAGYFARTIGKAFGDFYVVGGQTFDTFWGVFGWVDSPLEIVSPPIQVLVRLATTFGTLFFGAIAVARLSRSARRLRLIWLRGRPRLALRLAAGNPLINSYLAFTGVMFALYVATNDTFNAQGRNWVPFVIPAFWLGLISAASGLRSNRKGAGLHRLLAGWLLAYSAAGSVFAVQGIRDRYYGNGRGLVPVPVNSLRSLPGAATVHVDYTVTSDRVPGEHAAVVPARGYLAVGGWAADTTAGQVAATVVVTVDGARDYEAVYGDDSPAAVRELGSDAYRRAGFDIIVPVRDLGPGRHSLTFKVVPQGLGGFVTTSARVTFTVAQVP